MTKIDKNHSPLAIGQIHSSKAKALLHQALAEMNTANDILIEHAETLELKATDLLTEAVGARQIVRHNTMVHDKISSLLTA